MGKGEDIHFFYVPASIDCGAYSYWPVYHFFVCLFLAILTNAISSNTADDAIDVEMQSDMMMILSCLCDGDMHRKVFY